MTPWARGAVLGSQHQGFLQGVKAVHSPPTRRQESGGFQAHLVVATPARPGARRPAVDSCWLALEAAQDSREGWLRQRSWAGVPTPHLFL